MTHGNRRARDEASNASALKLGKCRCKYSGRQSSIARLTSRRKDGANGANATSRQTDTRRSHTGSAVAATPARPCTRANASTPATRCAATRSARKRSIPPLTGGKYLPMCSTRMALAGSDYVASRNVSVIADAASS